MSARVLCKVCLYPMADHYQYYLRRRGATEATCSECIQRRLEPIRAFLAEQVLLRGMVIKQAAYDLGLKEKTAHHHLAEVRRRITRSTNSWLVTNQKEGVELRHCTR